MANKPKPEIPAEVPARWKPILGVLFALLGFAAFSIKAGLSPLNIILYCGSFFAVIIPTILLDPKGIERKHLGMFSMLLFSFFFLILLLVAGCAFFNFPKSLPELIRSVTGQPDPKVRGRIESDFGNVRRVTKEIKRLTVPWTRIKVSRVVDGEKLPSLLELLGDYGPVVREPINKFIADTCPTGFQQRYGQWSMLDTNNMQVENTLKQLLEQWPTQKALGQTNKEVVLKIAIGIVEQNIDQAEESFKTWTTTNSFPNNMK